MAAKTAAGVPVIAPVPLFIERLAGSAGLIVKTRGAVPPAAVTGVNATAAVPAVRALVANTWLVVTGPFTVRLNVWGVVAPKESETVTVKVVVANAAAGVPEMMPVAVFIVKVAGRAGVIAKVRGAVPPAAVTGVNGVTAVPAVSVVLGTAWVATTAGFTVRLKVFAEVALALSVTVIV